MEEKTLESKTVFAGRIITVKVDRVSLTNGRTSLREVVLHPGAVAVLPLFDNGDVVLVKQFRYPVGEVLIEVPAGKLDLGEKPEQCALRELREETGINAGKLEYVGFLYTSPGFSNERIHLYIAEELSQHEQDLDVDEIVETIRLPLKDALRMCIDGEITDAKTVALLSLAFLKRG
ncbi:NUDIX domain-containing protein [Thermotoga caldifontis]|uniref:NUDIX domain-containing protein n=1 Tax=Thermotoga caldifontis TaxID=1508419 RepID=UPI000596F335|nr:NUDIX hydrolase [Thermotoga caldifontis]